VAADVLVHVPILLLLLRVLPLLLSLSFNLNGEEVAY
jgi:hypothetical protein